ncbi:MAG: hypothetical protein CSA83_00785 [Actinomycetales bacterium]|nr:MAG: hypothetical protein CSA83_00785 [Actinomycetales bacterium]
MGILTITSEYRHDSISVVIQLEPRRLRVIAEKLVALTVAITLIAVSLMIISAIALQIGSSITQTPLAMNAGELVTSWLASWLVFLLLGYFGFAIGLLLHGQLLSISVLFAITFIESILRPVSIFIFGRVTALAAMPFGLAKDVTNHTSILTGQRQIGFSPMMAFLLLSIWVAGLLLITTWVFQRRDVLGRA